MNKLQSYLKSTEDALPIRCNCTSGPLPISCKTVLTLLKICFNSIANPLQNTPNDQGQDARYVPDGTIRSLAR